MWVCSKFLVAHRFLCLLFLSLDRDTLTLTDLASVTENFTSNTRVQAVTLVDHNKLTPTLHSLLGEVPKFANG